MAGATVNRTLIACAKDEFRVNAPEKTRHSRVLILGGTGRVGGSTAIALSKLCPELRVIVGGRNRYMEIEIHHFNAIRMSAICLAFAVNFLYWSVWRLRECEKGKKSK